MVSIDSMGSAMHIRAMRSKKEHNKSVSVSILDTISRMIGSSPLLFSRGYQVEAGHACKICPIKDEIEMLASALSWGTMEAKLLNS